ncbi:MAG: 6-phosphogluconolactonase [Chloroflexi bacterium]|nr:6-phosphogluconolactonase [Chloroflexota bacterium]MDL1882542.1 6-phosphogluconolactonase [Anaerolineae bacterium CFX8]
MNERAVRILPNAENLAQAGLEQVVQAAKTAVAARRHFYFALSGGSTPRLLYERLASETAFERDWWRHTHIFWGDERCLPPTHPDSNYHMARAALLDHVPIPPENIHRMAGEREPEQAAADYEVELERAFGGAPRFDLILLGMGRDGHTASLFPHTPALRERTRRAVANFYAPVEPPWRITLTLPVINAAGVIFLVSGADKAETLRQVLEGEYKPDDLPAQLVRPAGGSLWLVDTAAARLLGA